MAQRNGFGEVQFAEIFDFSKKYAVLVVSIAAAGAGLIALRRYFVGRACTSLARLDGKTAVITGCNTGIGRETAKDLARRGARVIMSCRDLTKAERTAERIRRETGNREVTVKVLDLACLESVRRFCHQVLETESRVDILINNAGVMACPHWKTVDGIEMQFGVNHLGHFLLTNLLLDVIKKSAPSRIINVSSLAHEKGRIHFDDINLENNYNPWRAYAQSKLANVLFTQELHRRLLGTGVSVFALHPGVVMTELGRHLNQIGIAAWKLWLTAPVWRFVGKNPSQGAQTSIHCAVAEGLESHSGKYFSDCQVKSPAPQADDSETAVKLWELSVKMTGLATQAS